MSSREARFQITGGDLNSMVDALKKVGTPSFKVTASLEGELKVGFALTQAAVHVISGRLKASGHTETHFDGTNWTGSIIYGGPDGTPAYYGIYEMNRGGTRPDGTPHDFFAVLEPTLDRYREHLDNHMRQLER